MNISLEHLPECKARLSITIPADVVGKARQQVVSAFAREAKVPGFRPGKIPVAVVEKRFSDSIDSELMERLRKSAVNEARAKESVRILGISQIEREQLEADGSCLLALEVVTEPDVEVPDYQSIPVEVVRIEITDADVDLILDGVREKGSYKASTDLPAKDGQMIQITYSGKLDDEALSAEEYGFLASGEGLDYRVGEDTTYDFIPGLSKAGIGLSAGDTISHTSDFPEDYPNKEFVGKSIVFDVSVTGVFEMRLPDIDDKFAQQFGHESLEELRIWIYDKLVAEAEASRRDDISNQVVTFLMKDSSFDLPQHLVFHETQSGVSEMVMQGYRQGLSEEMITEHREQIVENAEKRARNGITARYVLLKVAELEGLTVSDQEIYYRIKQIAAEQNRPFKKVALEVRGSISRIREDVLIGKTLEHLRKNVAITEVERPSTSEEAQSIEASAGDPEIATVEPPAETSAESSESSK